jgi:LysR family transcriptional regulator of gallate degradation
MDKIYDLNLRHLGALSVISGAGSMSAAAEQVSLSQPALAQAVSKLERNLEVRLFERRVAGMRPTIAGVAWIIRTERALRYLTQGVRLVRRSARLAPLAHIERRVSMVQLRALVAVENCSRLGYRSRPSIAPCKICSSRWVRNYWCVPDARCGPRI